MRFRQLSWCAFVSPALLAAQNPVTQPRTHAPQPTSAAITARDLRTRLYIYAADSMQGRETGRPGQARATDYIASQLRALGLEPMGDSGTYFQNLPVFRRRLDPRSTITRPGIALVAGADFYVFEYGQQRAVASDTTIVFGGVIGRETVPLAPDVTRGKLVAYYIPPALEGHLSPAQQELVNTSDVDIRDSLRVTTVMWDGEVGLPFEATEAGVSLTRAAAERLFGAALDRLAVGATTTVRLDANVIDEPAPARNVIAAYRGRDPVLRNEWVAFGAHNDHIGVTPGPPVDHDSLHLTQRAAFPVRERIAAYTRANRICGIMAAPGPTAPIQGFRTGCSAPTAAQQAHIDSLNARIAAIHINLDSVRKANGGIRLDSIANGADDDGSGTVTLLEIAEKLAKTKPNTKRSMLFVWHTGEEKGLWGSRYLTSHPPVPLDSIVAQLNMDMVGRGGAGDLTGGGPTYLELLGTRRRSTELGDIVEMLNRRQPQPFQFDYRFDASGHPENSWCRSDQFNYARHGIPVVYARTGHHGDYHEVTDEPEYIDYVHMAKIGNFMYDLAGYLAAMDHRPRVDRPDLPDPGASCKQ
jgi:hypothetical protein